MKYIIRQPQSFSEIGRKDNQEDFLWPNPQEVSAQQRIFVLCDGVGGQENGEVASSTAATALGSYLTEHWPADEIVSRQLFEAALTHAYDELDKADRGDSVRKMATTMTCLVLHRGGALVAHIGDSRIYHIRPSVIDAAQGRPSIIYESLDHSLVNDLLRVGEITEEEARDFPQKNVITRAMQPGGERRCRADIFNIDDVKAGDYFFLCSDGVLEQLSNEALSQIVCAVGTDAEKIAAIKSVCDGRTRDNNTCWLVPIDSVILEPGDDERATTVVMASIDESPAVAAMARNAKSLANAADDPMKRTFEATESTQAEADPTQANADEAQAEVDEMSRTYERQMAALEQRQKSSRNGTILVGALVVAAVSSVFLYSRFTATEDPLRGLAPKMETDTASGAEDLMNDAANVEEIIEAGAEEQAVEAAIQVGQDSRAGEQSTPDKLEDTPQQTQNADVKQALNDALKRSENSAKQNPAAEAGEKPAESQSNHEAAPQQSFKQPTPSAAKP